MSIPSRSPSRVCDWGQDDAPPPSSGDEVDADDLEKGMEIEKESPLWKERVHNANTLWERFLAMPPDTVVNTTWKERGNDLVTEAKVCRAGLRTRKLLVYFPHGDGKATTSRSWRQARIRAEMAAGLPHTTYLTFPWPLERATTEALQEEWRRHRRPMPLGKWG